MNRRNFLRTAGAVSAALALPKSKLLQAAQRVSRTVEVTTRVELLAASGPSRIWLPSALAAPAPFQQTLSRTYDAAGGTAKTVESGKDGLEIVFAEFPAGVKPVLTLTSRIQTTDYSVDLSAPGNASPAAGAELEYFTRSTKLMPTDGVVKAKSLEITAGAKSDVAKARAIYEWIVDNTFRNPKTLGCGTGDIRFMLESGDLGGKCADLNSLYVGLARAAGLPARDVYGIRVAPSEMGYKSLGASSENVTKAQHCRAEVYLTGYGWVPVDPADVRKVVLEEPPGNLPLDHQMVKKARARLFGSWEMNWIAYNFAQEVALPGSTGSPLSFLMYPQAETADGRINSLNPDNFKYQITSKVLFSRVG